MLRTLTPDPPIVWESTRHKCLSQSLLSPHSTAWPAAAAFCFWWQHLTCHKISHKKPIISPNNTLQHYSTFTRPKYLILHILLALVCYPPLYDIPHDPNETQPVIDITIKLSLYYLYLVLHELPAALQIFYDNAFLKHKVKQNLITTTCADDITDILRILVFSLHLPSTAWPACSCPPCSTAWPWQWWLRWPCQGRHRHHHRQPPSFSATEMPVRRVPRGDHVESDNLRPNFDSSFGLPVLDHQP